MAELQTIPARHGVATFVPAGKVIKIINSSGTQVIDTWAIALPAPDPKKSDGTTQQESKAEDETKENLNKLKSSEFPSQEEAEKATRESLAKGEEQDEPAKKSTWASYVPSLGLGGGKSNESKGEDAAGKGGESDQKKNSKTWGEYFTAGKGFSSYIPRQATDTVSQFAASHERDKSKGYLAQLQDFSRTPVGAAGYSAMTGSGYTGSLYAGYQAWNLKHAANAPAMEFMSMPHSRAATLHLRPKVNDVFVTNIREPILTLVEDTSPGIHDTLIAACDPARYKGLQVQDWEQHGSCAENLVLALKELNERAGLKGAKSVGADITINSVPAPLNLFMNVPWDDEGDIGFKAPKGKKGDFVRFRAERDVVIVMSACPQDILDINGKQPTDGAFVVEDSEDVSAAVKRTAAPTKKKTYQPAKKPATTATAKSPAASGTETPTAPPKPTPTQPKKKPIPPPSKKPANAATSPAAPEPQPGKKPAAPQPLKTPASSSTSAPAKAPARPMKKPIPSTPATSTTTTNGPTTPPVEKKKPRKIARPQAVQ